MRESGLAGAGVGVAGVDDHDTDRAAGPQMLAAHLHRRRGVTILGEHRTHGTALIEQEDGQVLAIGLADARLRDTKAHTGDCQQITGLRRVEKNRHETPWMVRPPGGERWPPPEGFSPACRGSVCTFCRCHRGRHRCGRLGGSWPPLYPNRWCSEPRPFRWVRYRSHW